MYILEMCGRRSRSDQPRDVDGFLLQVGRGVLLRINSIRLKNYIITSCEYRVIHSLMSKGISLKKQYGLLTDQSTD